LWLVVVVVVVLPRRFLCEGVGSGSCDVVSW
jgi:hypothetical protein